MPCGLIVTGAGTYDTVENQIAQFTIKGDQAYNAAMDALAQIAASFGTKLAAAGLNLNPTPAKAAASLPEYQRPTPEPEAPDLSWAPPENPTAPPEIETDYSGYFTNLQTPVLTATPPTLQPVSRPSRQLPARPDDPDPLQVPIYPDAPTLIIPTLAEGIQIQLPTLADINLDGIRATITDLRNNLPTAPSVPQDIGFLDVVNQLYNSMSGQIGDTVGELLTKINELLSGGTGLPTAVALALRNRAYVIEDRLAMQAEQTAIADWLSRGFTLPGGALEVKLAEVRQQNRDKKEELNLNLWIEEAKLEIENMRFAVQQGIAYEAMRKDALTKLYGVAGDLAAKSADVQIKLVEAAVNIFEAEANMWQIQFASIRDEIQAELGKIEIFKGELEGQRLIGELNQQDIQRFAEMVKALELRANLYKTEVDAANSKLQGELGKLQIATEKTKIYATDIGAWEAEWRAFGEAIRADQNQVELFNGLIRAFVAETDAYGKATDTAKSQATLEQEGLRLRLQAWESQLKKWDGEIRAESTRISALSDVYRNQMSGYALKHEAEKTYVGTELQKLEYLLNVDRLNADTTIKEAELEQDKVLQLTKITQDSFDAVARTSAQLAGSAMSAMNVGATISAGSSIEQRSSCNENYNYEG